jgi:predicted nucleotidyltransferase
MRLSEKEKNIILHSVKRIDPSASVYLFGSRTDDSKRGGDIDLVIVSALIDRNGKRMIRSDFCDVFGEQRLDIIIDNGDFADPFVKKIIQNAIKL